MDPVKFDYYSMRASKARFGFWFRRIGVSLSLTVMALCVLGGIALLAIGIGFGWFLLSMAAPAYVFYTWYQDELRHIPSSRSHSIDSRISGDILGQLPKHPTPKDIATAVGHVPSGHFMAVRLGVTANLLQQVASDREEDAAALWQLADEIRQKNGITHISGSVLAAALVRSFRGYEDIIAHMHLDDADLDAGVRWQDHIRQLIDRHRIPRRTGGVARDWSFGYIPLLTRFGRNISQEIASGGGRLLTVEMASHNGAMDQLVDTFGGGGRQNAVLVGKEGVGKTSTIYAFAEHLLDATASIPSNLKFRQVFVLDSSALIAAAPGRGELENLVMKVLSEAYSAKNIIICLDNAQLFFEEGVGSVDLANVLQPILDAGRLRVILSMNEQRYLQIGQRNPSLINSLNRINIEPANEEETLRVMEEQLLATEMQRKVIYMYQSLKEAYRLSERYVHDLAQPGRAIKLLESAASYAEEGRVTINSVQHAIEKTLGVKISVANTQEDRERLLNMEEIIHKRMVNQTRAVGVVSDALRRARAGVRNQNRPIGTFLFLGPTGVGKTELSKALGDVYFGGEDRMIRIDLNEYVQAEDVSRLIADGADDPMSLTAQIMKQPFSVVLLDEIEKAAPQVLATLLQLLDEGILRDTRNREVSFRDAIVIATSNAGADRIREYVDRGYKMEQFERQFVDELISSNQFRPEFLNRFDEIVLFRPFTKDELLQVLDLILAGVNKTLALQKVSVVVEPDAKLFLVERGYDPRLGARPMRRVVQKTVENTVARQMLSGTATPGSELVITLEQCQQVFAGDEISPQIPVSEISQ